MRILLTTDTVGGVWTFSLDLAQELLARDCAVGLATLGRALSPSQRAELDRLPGLECFDGGFKVEWMEDPWDDLERSNWWFSQVARDFRPDLVHLNTLGINGLSWRGPVVVTAHSCVLSWWRAVKGEDAPPNWARYQLEVQRTFDGANAVIAPSEAMMEQLKSCYGLESTNCHVIYNGRRTEQFARGDKEPWILTAGRLWDEGKNVAALVSAAASVKWPVCLAGDRGRTPLGSMSNCRALGVLSSTELRQAMTRAAIYAAPARYEPFGISILEAALCGCALVLGDIPSLREIWGDSAVYVPPGDSGVLAKALSSLIENESARNDLARASTARAHRFTAGSMAQAYLNLYAGVSAKRTTCA